VSEPTPEDRRAGWLFLGVALLLALVIAVLALLHVLGRI